MAFHENWFGWPSCRVLGRLAKRTRGLEGRIVEVGSWEGRSTVALANAVYPDVVHAVDTWLGSPGEISAELAAERDVFQAFQSNIGELTRGNVIEHRCDWRDFFALDRSPIRFLFIDATHTYEEVRENIEAAQELIVPGGIVCGDDAHHEPVIRAVRDVLGAFHVEATLWIWEREAN